MGGVTNKFLIYRVVAEVPIPYRLDWSVHLVAKLFADHISRSKDPLWERHLQSHLCEWQTFSHSFALPGDSVPTLWLMHNSKTCKFLDFLFDKAKSNQFFILWMGKKHLYSLKQKSITLGYLFQCGGRSSDLDSEKQSLNPDFTTKYVISNQLIIFSQWTCFFICRMEIAK